MQNLGTRHWAMPLGLGVDLGTDRNLRYRTFLLHPLFFASDQCENSVLGEGGVASIDRLLSVTARCPP